MNRFIQIILTAAACIFCGKEVQAQVFDLGASYSMNIATGEMGETLDNVHSFHFEVTAKPDHLPVAIGLGFQIGRYSRHKSDIDFEIDENSFIRAPLIVNHRFTMFNIPVRYTILPPGPIVPYAIVRASLGLFSSNAQVRDPDVSSSAEGAINLYEENLHSYATFVVSAGGGCRIDVADMLRSVGHNRIFIDLEAAYLIGGKTSYAFSERADGHRADSFNPEEAGYELKDHGYHTTEKFRDQLSMLSLRAGVVFRFDAASRD